MRLLFSFLFGCLCIASIAGAEPRSPSPSPSPSRGADDERCYLTVVEGVVKACCDKTGGFINGAVNCTNFAHNFDKLCSEAIGPENCFTVSAFCSRSGVAHRLNMVKLGDGRYYIVEPQGEVYYDYPLPSPQVPESVMNQILRQSDCHSVVYPYNQQSNTDDRCSDNDALLLGAIGSAPGPQMLELCYSCCSQVAIPPRHPDPESFRAMCRRKCEFSYKPEPDDGPEFFSRYCSRMYTGRACAMCCSYLEEGRSCEDSCVDSPVMPAEIPSKDPSQCRKEHPDVTGCLDCCKEQFSFCGPHESIPCQEWMLKCFHGCDAPRPPPGRSPSPSPSPKR